MPQAPSGFRAAPLPAGPANSPPSSPPPARLAFRVGIVGHRPNRLQEADAAALSRTLGSILATVRETVVSFHGEPGHPYAQDTPVLRAVSPLAEGADRIFADEALRSGYELCCPMPFPQAEYEKDFTATDPAASGSLDEFRELLERARQGSGLVAFELDGTRDDDGAAYGAAGRVVLIQSDLLVAVWDGGEAQGAGGTGETLSEALRYRIPVVWIDAAQPHPWRILHPDDDLKGLSHGGRRRPEAATAASWEELRQVVREVVAWPPSSGDPQAAEFERMRDQMKHHASFLRERKPSWNPAFLWKLFRDLVGSGRVTFQSLKVPGFEQSIADKWPTDPASGVAGWVNRRLRPHYAWSDKLADLNADSYRSTFVLAYLVAALAVLLALLPGAAGWHDGAGERRRVLSIALEFAMVAGILVAFFWARHRRWHARWMDCRMLAEMFRQMRFQIPLGGARSRTRLPAHLSAYGDPSMTWMSWHKLAVEREIGLPSARIDHGYLAQYLDYLESVVEEQLGFHGANWRRSERIERNLHRSVMFLFALTLLCIGMHLAPSLAFLGLGEAGHSGRLDGWLTVACAFLPALGGALAGINEQGEFARLSKRSRAMHERLGEVAQEIRTLRAAADPATNPLKLGRVAQLVAPTAQLMVDEVLDWRVIFRDRPLVLHP